MNTEFQTSFIVFPADANFNTPPSVFGGKVLAEMDICAALTVRRAIQEEVAAGRLTDAITVHVTDVNFVKGAQVGELVFVNGRILRFGMKSIDVALVATRQTTTGKMDKIADGTFRFVTRLNGVPTAHNLSMPDREAF